MMDTNNSPTVMLLKLTVATEVAFYLRQSNAPQDLTNTILLNMIRAYDMPDKWWEGLDRQRLYSKASSGPSVQQWAKIFYHDPYGQHLNECEPNRLAS